MRTAVLLLALTLAPAGALAQSATDVVLTRGGGLLRGQIIESAPGQQVTIQLPNGESRTVPWADVEYAGPETRRPGAVPPPPPSLSHPTAYAPMPPPSDAVRVQVTSEQDGLALHEVTGTATASAWTGQGMATIRAFAFRRLCGVPCALELPRGSHHLALSRGGTEVPARPLDILRDGTLQAEYVDRSALRVAGFLAIILGAVGGGAWMIVPILTSDLSSDDWLVGLIGGGSILVVSEIVGLILAFQGDGAELRFD